VISTNLNLSNKRQVHEINSVNTYFRRDCEKKNGKGSKIFDQNEELEGISNSSVSILKFVIQNLD